jgi:hypothetical protein
MANQPNINVSTSRGDEAVKIIVYGVVGLAVVGLAYFGVIKPILNAIGLTTSKEDREAQQDEEKLSRKQVLSPLLYRDNKSKITISSGKANQSAYNIYVAKGTFYDDESLAVGSITSAGSLVNISYIADVFADNYGSSLESYLESFLENSDWNTIENYIDKTKKF